jgi:hypothetical protein
MQKKILVALYAVGFIICLSGMAPEPPFPNEPAPTDTIWRLMRTNYDSYWTNDSEGGSTLQTTQYYYNQSVPSHLDSLLIHYQSIYSTNNYIYYYTYTDYPEYHQVDVIQHLVGHPEQDYRILYRYDLNNRCILKITYSSAAVDAYEKAKEVYSYDDAGNRLEFQDWKSYPAPYGPKYVTRYTYTTGSRISTRFYFRVNNNDLNNLYPEQRYYWAYDTAGRMLVRFKTSNNASYNKDLYQYTDFDSVSVLSTYTSSDSLSWSLWSRNNYTYGLSFNVLRLSRLDLNYISASDSTIIHHVIYYLYQYQDNNRNILRSCYAENIDSESDHWIYNQAMKILESTHYSSYQTDSEYSHTSYEWDYYVPVDDPQMPPPGIMISIFPNPVRYRSVISCKISDTQQVELKIFNIRGQMVGMLEPLQKVQGVFEADLDPQALNLPSGIYLLRATRNGKSMKAKFIVIR